MGCVSTSVMVCGMSPMEGISGSGHFHAGDALWVWNLLWESNFEQSLLWGKLCPSPTWAQGASQSWGIQADGIQDTPSVFYCVAI